MLKGGRVRKAQNHCSKARQPQWHMSIIPILRSQGRRYLEFTASLSYTGHSRLTHAAQREKKALFIIQDAF